MLPKSLKPKRTKTPEQALTALMRLAARSEKSSGDALRLMQNWGVEPTARQGVLQKLIDNKFIDDRRYAEAYVREKSRLAGWGARKIALQLRIKGVAQDVINEALRQIDDSDVQQRLCDKLRRKIKITKASSDFELRGKLFRYALSQGYDYDQINQAIAQVVDGFDG